MHWLKWGTVLTLMAAVFTGEAALARQPAPKSAALPAAELDTHRWIGRPLDLLLRQWGEETGTRLTVAPELLSQKVTVELTPGATLRQASSALASLLGAEWVEAGAKGHQDQGPGFLLRRAERTRKELEERARQENALRDEATREQAQLLLKAIDRAAAEVGRPPRQLAEGIVGRPYINPEAESLASLLGTLTPAQREQLARSPNYMIDTGDRWVMPRRVSALTAPIRALSPAQQRHIQQFLLSRGIATDPASGVVQFTNENGLSVSVRIRLPDGSQAGEMAAAVDEGKAVRRLIGGSSLPGGPRTSPAPAVVPQELSQKLHRQPPAPVNWVEVDYGEAIRRLGSQFKIPVVADYYTLRARLTLRGTQIKPADLLQAVLRAFDCEARWENGVLLLRARRWVLLDRREIAEEHLLRWEADKRRRLPDDQPQLDTLGEMASTLRVEQLPCLSEYRPRDTPLIDFLYEEQSLRLDGDLLTLWGRLSSEQRLAALGPGMALRTLDARARQAAESFVLGKAAGWLSSAEIERLVLRLTPEVTAGESQYTLELRGLDGPYPTALRFPTSIPVLQARN